MTRIDKLTRDLCPDGVQSVRLGDLTFESSVRNAQQLIHEVRSVTNSHGLIRTADFFANTRTSTNTSAYKVVQPGMFVYNPSRVNVGSISWLDEPEPVIVSPMYVVFGIDASKISPAYLMLFLESAVGKARIDGKTEIGARFRLTYASLSSIEIPLPPLDVQREIVRILGPFTELEAALKAELAARRRQYDFYRVQILASGSESRVVRLGEVATVRYGRDFPKSLQGSSDGHHPFFKVIDMARPGNEVSMTTSSNYVDSEELAALGIELAPAGTILLPRVGAAVATNKKRMLGVAAAFDTSFIALLPTADVLPRYLLHLLASVDLMTLSNKGAALPSVRRDALENLMVPIPAIVEQRRIIDILDKFDALVNDQNIGIPAELHARRRQYEYYRDKLLAFQEVPA